MIVDIFLISTDFRPCGTVDTSLYTLWHWVSRFQPKLKTLLRTKQQQQLRSLLSRRLTSLTKTLHSRSSFLHEAASFTKQLRSRSRLEALAREDSRNRLFAHEDLTHDDLSQRPPRRPTWRTRSHWPTKIPFRDSLLLTNEPSLTAFASIVQTGADLCDIFFSLCFLFLPCFGFWSCSFRSSSTSSFLPLSSPDLPASCVWGCCNVFLSSHLGEFCRIVTSARCLCVSETTILFAWGLQVLGGAAAAAAAAAAK